MGTTIGFKPQSYNTTVRNPERYKEILKAISEFDGSVYNAETKTEIMIELYRKKLVTPNKIKTDLIDKYISDEELTKDEAIQLMD